MCGITGAFVFNEEGSPYKSHISAATNTLNKRGPDHQDTFLHNDVALGHARLSIIDTSAAAHQPFHSSDHRYTIVFNGEIYNYANLRKELEQEGFVFRTNSDTEVLLNLYIHHGEGCLELLNGFFAFGIYDTVENTLFLARDRMGIKPLLWYEDENAFLFGSEMKALMAYEFQREIDSGSLFLYLQLNYIPAPNSILKGVQKLLPGHCIRVSKGKVETKQWYAVPRNIIQAADRSYEEAQQQLHDAMRNAVTDRLVADVPLGSFLSGGVDSSVIATLAVEEAPGLQTFSIGYHDEPMYDETRYAEAVANKIGSKHQVFKLKNNDLLAHFDQIVDYIDEPFADSSAIAVYILSRETRKHVTVALSGDGADEIFSGYNKHEAEWRARQKGAMNTMVKAGAPLWKALPKSRGSKLGNLARQLDRFSQGMKMPATQRYWEWASFLKSDKARALLAQEVDDKDFESRQQAILKHIRPDGDLNDVLYTDAQLVLPNDMLTKVDLMSMANSLEVRTPFLDHNVVELAFSLPEAFKIDGKMRKKILQDTFRPDLPEIIYQRPKHGFEVPLVKWFREELKDRIMNDLLDPDFVREQAIFKVSEVEVLKKELFSNAPGDSPLTIWALIVFQLWWKKYMA